MRTYTLKRGDTWELTLNLYSDKDKTIPFDATQDGGYDGQCYIKEELDEARDAVVTVDLEWEDQSTGIATMFLTTENSLKLRLHKYVAEFKVYADSSSAGNEVRQTVEQAYLDVVEVLDKD